VIATGVISAIPIAGQLRARLLSGTRALANPDEVQHEYHFYASSSNGKEGH
jgi:hypothetical protein